METSRFNSQVRMAGSLETSNRKYVRNARIEVERETSSFYDELFAPTPASAISNHSRANQQNQSTISPSNNKLYKSKSDRTHENSDDSIYQRNESKSPPRTLRDFSHDSDMDSSSNHSNRSPRNKRTDKFKFKNMTNTGEKKLNSSTKSFTRTSSNDTISQQSQQNQQRSSPTRRINMPLSDDEDNDDVARAKTQPLAKRNAKSGKRHSIVRPIPMTSNSEEEEELPPNNYNHEFFRNIDSIEFLFKPAPRRTLIQSRIRVQANTIAADEFEVVLENCADRTQPLLKTTSKTAAGVFYYINAFTDGQQAKSSKLKKLGRVESNFSKKKYNLLKYTNDGSDDYEDKPSTQDIFELTYSNRVIADDKPKDIKLTLINENERDRSGRISMLSKKPELDPETKTYRLDFRGRAQLPSTSNLQLVQDDGEKSADPVFQLGRLDKHEFAMDFSYPLNFFTAFGIALAALSRG